MSFLKRSTEYNLIAKSKYFNKRWYLRKYADVASKRVDPVTHYLEHGWKEGRNPGPKFSTELYLKNNPDVAAARINPLLHYERNGKYEVGRIAVRHKCNRFLYKYLSFVHKCFKRADIKRILLISHEFTYTGAPLSLLKAAQLLKEKGYEIITVSLKAGGLETEFKKLGKVIITSNLNKILRCATFADFAVVNTIIPYEAYDMLKNFMPTAWWIREPVGVLKGNCFMRQIFMNADNVYTMSPWSRDEFLPYNRNIEVMPHGLDDMFAGSKAFPKKPTFAVIGSIHPRKGQDVFIDAVKKLPAEIRKKAAFLIVGKLNVSDSDWESLGAPKCIQVKPEISNFEDMIKFYGDISCTVVPSREEPTSRVAIESMMMGRPVVMSDQVGAQYLVNSRNGYVFKNEDAKQLSGILAKLIKSPEKLKTMGKYAREAYLKNNSIPVYTKNLLNMLSDCKNSFDNKPTKILVHIHLFYHEQLDWFISRLKNITCDYDLWITVTEKNKETEDKIKNFKPDTHILKVPNRGYDLYPFWLVLQNVSLFDYDAVLKLHTKNKRTKKWCKNGICYNGFEWRNDLINPLLGSKKLFQKAVDFVKCDNIGMVGSANLIGNKENPEQAKNTKKLCELMGIKYSHDGKFVCGTMFLIKANLLLVFQQYPFKKSDFSSESKTGSTGTVAHSLETVMGLIVADRKLKLVGVDTLGTSFKHFCARYKQKYINLLKTIRKRKKEVDYIKHSKYFSKRWYLRTYPDVAKAKVNPAHHYLLHGWKEGRKPGPKFDPKFYLENNLDVKRAGVNPLLHYEKHGKYEGRIVCLKRSLKPAGLKEFHDVYVDAFKWRGKIAKRVVVSLTTYPGRIKSVYETINTLKNQSVKPDKVVLYLSEQEFPKKDKGLPRNLTKLCDDCFEIHWIKKTLYSFQKLIPAIKEYPNAVIVTADDDILYKSNWLELLVKAYLENPNIIHCHRAHRIKFRGGHVISYNLWKMAIRNESALYNNFLTGVGGVLYPPHCLDKNITNSKEFLKLCPKADDIWIWAMAVKNHTKIHVIKDNITALELVPGSQDGDCLCKINTGAECYNDVQLKNVFAKYPEILEMLKDERRKNAILSYLLYPYYLLYFLRKDKR